MGVLEKESRKNTRNRKLQGMILQTVLTAGALSMSRIVPNVMNSMREKGLIPNLRQREIINMSRYRLVRLGLLSRNAKGFLVLTDKGAAKLRQFELHNFKLRKPRRWDKKWRLLTFDIREDSRHLRNKIRKTLIAIGFFRLHQSVFVYPYDCEDLITLLKMDFKVGKELVYVIADKIENDFWLRKHFGLTS